MPAPEPKPRRLRDAATALLLRFGPLDRLSPRVVVRSMPAVPTPVARHGRLHVEIVSHCWQYAHLLAWQLSSLINNPPTRLDVTVTVFHAREDRPTAALLDRVARMAVPGVRWNFRVLAPGRLRRRAIGRDLAARATAADWVWFTDCDVLFEAGCLDGLSDALQGCVEPLVYPREDRCTPLLVDGDDLLEPTLAAVPDLRPDTTRFELHRFRRAQGAYQITHGDVARALGYCAQLPMYQQPADRWCKTYEDRAFRWLLGTDGVPIDVPGLYRIRHVSKGRYRDRSRTGASLRSAIRRVRSRLNEGWRRQFGRA